MTLAEYLKGKGHGEISRLARTAGVSRQSVHRIVRIGFAQKRSTAIRLSGATGGVVSPEEILGLDLLEARADHYQGA